MSETDAPIPSYVPVDISDEMRSSYMDYAMSVIIGRALPDVRDGLKPVHRRILYAMHEGSNTWNRAHKKSARIVGDVIGKYHPHGDSAVYESLVRMAQPFSMRLPLVDGQGNFGSVDGDPAAAMRYTEVRMTRACAELLADIEKDTVDFGPNYDGSEHEPLVLPTRIPNLLVNGSEGIAVGMATRIPPHNLGEVVSACLHLIDHPEATVADLMQFIPGPDFPTAGLMYERQGMKDAYETGRGVVRLRARTHIETDERTNKDSIIVTELPFQVNKARLLEKIAELVREKSIEGITDLRDESDRTGMRMVIELRRDVNAQVILNQLFRRTQLETSFGINMLAIVQGQPKVLTLTEVLHHFLDFRRDVVTRRSIFELREAEARMHILEALKKALDMIDAVIRTIRASSSAEEANEGLRELLGIDEVQAQAILQMRLQRLTQLEISKLVEEMEALQRVIDRLRLILSSQTELLGVIRTELQEILSAYREPRLTEILNISGGFSMEDLIADEDEVVTLSSVGYIKRTPLAEYRSQRRGGKGRRGMETRDEDFVTDVWVTNTHASLLVFMDDGKAFRLKVHEIPAGSPTAKGKPVVNLLPVDPSARVKAVLPFESFDSGHFVLTATRRGLVKKTPLKKYRNIHSAGLIGVRVPEGDELIGVHLCRAGDRLMLVSSAGRAITFDQAAARPLGRNSQGVRGIRVKGEDEVVSLVVIPREELLSAGIISEEDLTRYLEADDALAKAADDDDDDAADTDDAPVEADDAGDEEMIEGDVEDFARTVLTITENGFGKRTRIREYPVKGRGGMGVITIKTSARNGLVVGSRLVSDTDELILITDGGKIIRTPVGGISLLGRNTQGVKIISLDKGEKVMGIARFESEDDEEAAAAAATAEGATAEGAIDGAADAAEGTTDAPAEDAEGTVTISGLDDADDDDA